MESVVIDRIMAVVEEVRGAGRVARHGEKNLHPRIAKNAILGWGTQRELGQPASLTRKQRGEMAEAAFLTKAAGLGFRVSKPWGESSRYDLIVDNGRRLLRVQVKSAHRAGEHGGYTFHAHGNTARVYRSSEIDLLVAYVVPVEAWYLFSCGRISKVQIDEAVSRKQEEEIEVREVSGSVGDRAVMSQQG
jgi:hypothetical protein